MTLRTMGSPGSNRCGAISPEHIDPVRYSLHVVGIHTAGISAQVVYRQPWWNPAAQKFVGKAVNDPLATHDPNDAVILALLFGST